MPIDEVKAELLGMVKGEPDSSTLLPGVRLWTTTKSGEPFNLLSVDLEGVELIGDVRKRINSATEIIKMFPDKPDTNKGEDHE